MAARHNSDAEAEQLQRVKVTRQEARLTLKGRIIRKNIRTKRYQVQHTGAVMNNINRTIRSFGTAYSSRNPTDPMPPKTQPEYTWIFSYWICRATECWWDRKHNISAIWSSVSPTAEINLPDMTARDSYSIILAELHQIVVQSKSEPHRS